MQIKQTKYEKYEQLAADTLRQLTASRDNWLNYLDTASRMYKYSFDEQVLIYAQRPDTKACAEFSLWAAPNGMNRHIKRNTKSIVLINRDTKSIRHVYAVEDTEPRANGQSKDPEAYIWQLTPEKRSAVNDMILRGQSIKSESLEQTIVSMAYSMAHIQANRHSSEFDTIYNELELTVPKEQFRAMFTELIAASAAYTAAKRAGTDVSAYLPKTAFANLSLFGNAKFTALLGSTTAATAEPVISRIERTVKELNALERSADYGKQAQESIQNDGTAETHSRERDSVHVRPENADVSRVRGRDGDRRSDDRSIRENEGGLPQGELRSDVQPTAADESAHGTSASDRQTGVGNGAEDSRAVSSSGRDRRGAESDRPVEVGRSDEQLQNVSTGNNNQGTDRDRRSRSVSSSDEAEVITTSAFPLPVSYASTEEAIHGAFTELELNHSFTEKQAKFLKRLEGFAIKHSATENLVDTAFSMFPAYRNTYGNRDSLSKNVFSRRLGSIERELEEAIQRNIGSISEKEPVTLDDVIEHFFNSDRSEVRSSDGAWSINYTDGAEFAEVYHIGKPVCGIYLNDGKFMVKPYEQSSIADSVVTAMQNNIFDSTVTLLPPSIKTGTQALYSIEQNSEMAYYKLAEGVTADDVLKAVKNGESLDSRISRISEVEYAEIQQSTDFTFSVEVNRDNDSASVYTVNDGKGGLSEGDRDDDSILITGHKLSEYGEELQPQAAERPENSLIFHFGDGSDDTWVSESSIVHDFAMENPECSFALANAVFEYLDDKQHTERNIEELHAGWYKKTNFLIEATINGDSFSYGGRYDIGDGKGTGGGSLIEHIRDYNASVIANAHQYPYSRADYQEKAKNTLDILVPYLESHSELTAEERRIFADLKAKYPVRGLPDENPVQQQSNTPKVSELAVGDVIMYDGARREVENISERSISLKNLDSPTFGGILLATSDVLAYDGWQEDMESKGFEILSKADNNVIEQKQPQNEQSAAPVSDSSEVESISSPSEDISTQETAQQSGLVEINTTTFDEVAYEMWEDGFAVYADGERIPAPSVISVNRYNEDNANAVEIFRVNHTFTVSSEDLEQFGKLQHICNKLDNICESNEEINIVDYASDEDFGEPFDWNTGQNAYLNVEQAFLEGKTDFIEAYLDDVTRDIPFFDTEDTAALKDDIKAYISEYGSQKKTNAAENIDTELTVENLKSRYFHADSNRQLDSYEMAGLVFLDGEDLKIDEITFFNRFHAKKYSPTQADEIRSIITAAMNHREKLQPSANESLNTDLPQNINTIIDLSEYGITVDLSKVKDFVIEDTNYLKNNESKCRMFTTSLGNDGIATTTVITEDSSEHPSFSFDLSDDTDVRQLKNTLSDFISHANAESLNIYSLSEDNEVVESYDIPQESEALTLQPVIIEKYGITLDFNEISSVELEELQNENFGAELDSDGHERKDNIGYKTVGVSLFDDYGSGFIRRADLIDGGVLGDFPVTAAEAAAEIEEFLDKAADNNDYTAYVVNKDGSRTVLNASVQISETADVVSEKQQTTEDVAIIEDSNSEKLTTTVKGNDLNIGDKVMWEGNPYEIESKGGLLGMKPLFETTATIVSPSIIWRDKEFEVYEFAPQQLSFGDEIIEQPSTSLPAESATNTVTPQTAEKADTTDFIITDDKLGEGGAKTKFRANVEAIRTLKAIEAENRPATAEEQQVLSQYVGWGGLKNAFEDFHDDWKNEYNELKELLTADEYSAAAASVLNAHYTAPLVIEKMYEALKNNGFDGGKILEPSMGVGNFFGKMPTDIREKSKLYGVELDSISGRIAQQLYPSANIKITGFEKLDVKDNTYDLAVGNVPFGGYGLNEAAYNKYHFLIHDHFFAKSLDKVKPKGIVAFITSKGTLDKANPAVRKYIAERAELVGAIRLPNTAFKGNAGTEVTSDIIFLQKREKPIELTPDTMPSWIDLGRTEDGLPVNQYFIDNPDMVLGKIVEGNKLYGRGDDDTMCIPIEGADLSEQLEKAIGNIHFTLSSETSVQEESAEVFDDEVEIPLGVRDFSYCVVNDNIYYRNKSDMLPFTGKSTDVDRIKGMIELRDCVRELIQCQIDNGSDEQVKALQDKLSGLYDGFVAEYGMLHDKKNVSAFKEDSAAPLLQSLEKYKGEEFVGKAPIFTKRTILPKMEVTSVDTSSEALTLSLAKKARVDMPYMQELTGFTAEKILDDLKNVVYENPMKLDENGNPRLESADEYLSGNIRIKLEYMQEHYADDSRYAHNIQALESAMPPKLEAADIDIKLGSPCVKPQFVQEFMYDLFNTPYYMRGNEWHRNNRICVSYSDVTSRWFISNKADDKNNTAARNKYGTQRCSPYELLEDCLNLKPTVVRDRVDRDDGKSSSIVNQEETDFAQEKQNELQAAFKEWIYADPKRREEVVDTYNRMFNSIRPREYDGSALEFTGMNSEISLREHQKNAVAHALYGGNTLFAHEVGAGKTYEMIAAAMEGKRLGLHNKALLCVPNHLTEQEGADFIKLYPNANILVATANDFTKENRRKLFAKIATGDYDCIIIGHSQLVNLPISPERQKQLLEGEIQEIIEGIEAIKAEKGDNFQIKQMEKTRKSLQAKLEKLVEAPKRDDVVYFEELGIDKLIIDEAHMFKNLFISTKMSNVSGISTNDDVQKTFDLYLKTQYLDEVTGNKGVIFATGTPVSNSISEIYTMMKYLQGDLLEQTGLKHFDSWAANFAEIKTESQLSPEGNNYQMKTRFAKFNNMPELMALFKECADIKTADQLGLEIPDCEMHTVVAQPSELQKELIDSLSERARRIRQKMVNSSEDNMLNITSDGRKIGLDVRLINPDLPDDENSKLNVCINNVYNIWDKTAENRSTQVIFCDLGVPQSTTDKKKNGEKFSVYDDIKAKLIMKGIPPEEIAFIHDAKSEEAKDKLFAKVRKGEVRVLIGSTQKMGAGTNIQDKLIASHDLDAPWKPSDMEQRRGRMVRQGNENKKVDLYRYVTEGTFDSYLYQMLENKQKFISQIMSSKLPVRSCEDLDEVSLSYAEIKALAAGNPLIKEKMDLDIEVGKLKSLKASHQNSMYQLQDKVRVELPREIERMENDIAAVEKDIAAYKARPIPTDENGKPAFPSIEINGKVYTDKKEAGAALLDACKKALMGNAHGTFSEILKCSKEIGSYQGFKLKVGYDPMSNVYIATLIGAAQHRVQLGSDEIGNFTRLDNALNGMEQRLEKTNARLDNFKTQLAESTAQLNAPFPREAELQEKSARLEEVTKILESAADEKPSRINEIVDPFYIEVGNPEKVKEILDEHGITYDISPEQNDDGNYALKVNGEDVEKVKRLLFPATKNLTL